VEAYHYFTNTWGLLAQRRPRVGGQANSRVSGNVKFAWPHSLHLSQPWSYQGGHAARCIYVEIVSPRAPETPLNDYHASQPA